MKLQIKYIPVFILPFALAGCLKTEFKPLERTQGDANFKNYVSVGNSLTQGYQDGGLHNELDQQEYSYPAIIARQMQKCNPEMNAFKQPLVYENGSGFLKLAVDADGELGVLGSGDPGGASADVTWEYWGNTEVKYNNLGVAGISVKQIAARNFTEEVFNHAVLGGVGLLGGEPLNPFGRFLDFGEDPTNFFGGGDTYDYVHHVEQSNATFFTCWLGNNDVLGWALSGGDDQELEIAGFGLLATTPLTPADEFYEKYERVMQAFQAQGAKGVCATIPYVTSIPNLTTVDEEYLGVEEIWIEEADGTVRLKNANDLVSLYALDDFEAGFGTTQSQPFSTGVVLDEAEVNEVQTRIDEINAVITQLANIYGFAVVDMQNYLEGFKTGFSIAGVDFSATFVEGGVFSLDGVHPNRKGYAIVANKFIEAINLNYGSNIPPVDVNQYKGIVFP